MSHKQQAESRIVTVTPLPEILSCFRKEDMDIFDGQGWGDMTTVTGETIYTSIHRI
jgi:hypothetical protein